MALRRPPAAWRFLPLAGQRIPSCSCRPVFGAHLAVRRPADHSAPRMQDFFFVRRLLARRKINVSGHTMDVPMLGTPLLGIQSASLRPSMWIPQA